MASAHADGNRFKDRIVSYQADVANIAAAVDENCSVTTHLLRDDIVGIR